ncbi:hypothetical protein [Nocardioides marmorisolisilvae]|uniref:Uncharacterized protein n=1 Tax=Nocardioides marmorisolisilvae TaxID=1542737 RepID=A0A3N0DZ86_9ACTN|nr:hypothetical protein [Nocardioides marmorisolisilvae]RNL80907.1 hypothetical protein EFL95_00515 [Nocardioides marmorisolisilvae]
MKLFRRRTVASLRLDPGTAVRPTDTLTVTVEVDEAVPGVTAARIELGYVNGFRYHWAGKQAALASQGQDSLLTAGQLGTNYGGDKDSDAWVSVIDAPLTVAAGVLGSGPQQVQLRLPSWAPGTAGEVVRWEARLHVERSGKDTVVAESFTVLSVAPDPAPTSAELPLIQGERALANSILFEIETERGTYRPGEEVRGTVAVTPRDPVDRSALLAVWFQQLTDSHPVEKNPTLGPSESFVRPMTSIAKDVRLVQGQRSEFPFALTLPADAMPTLEAVHSSVRWFVQIKVEFSGMTGAIERAERGIVVHTG